MSLEQELAYLRLLGSARELQGFLTTNSALRIFPTLSSDLPHEPPSELCGIVCDYIARFCSGLEDQVQKPEIVSRLSMAKAKLVNRSRKVTASEMIGPLPCFASSKLCMNAVELMLLTDPAGCVVPDASYQGHLSSSRSFSVVPRFLWEDPWIQKALIAGGIQRTPPQGLLKSAVSAFIEIARRPLSIASLRSTSGRFGGPTHSLLCDVAVDLMRSVQQFGLPAIRGEIFKLKFMPEDKREMQYPRLAPPHLCAPDEMVHYDFRHVCGSSCSILPRGAAEAARRAEPDIRHVIEHLKALLTEFEYPWSRITVEQRVHSLRETYRGWKQLAHGSNKKHTSGRIAPARSFESQFRHSSM